VASADNDVDVRRSGFALFPDLAALRALHPVGAMLRALALRRLVMLLEHFSHQSAVLFLVRVLRPAASRAVLVARNMANPVLFNDVLAMFPEGMHGVNPCDCPARA
jgi:hypothetical protein